MTTAFAASNGAPDRRVAGKHRTTLGQDEGEEHRVGDLVRTPSRRSARPPDQQRAAFGSDVLFQGDSN
jgi:hypothetical protein